MIDDDSDDAEIQEIPLPNVKSSILSKIIEFAQYNAVTPMNELPKPLKSPILKDFVQEWYVDFIAVKQPVLFELIRAANYMDIKPLLELGCASIASLIKGKKEDEVRALFQNEGEVTHEGEAQVCEEN
jgi:S-phase kinase-associated protein 1